MKLLVLYLGICLIGYFVGSYLRRKEKKVTVTGKIQTIMLIVILFVMGARLGSDDKVINSLGTIGVTAFVITILTLVFSVAAVFFTRKMLGINKKGEKVND